MKCLIIFLAISAITLAKNLDEQFEWHKFKATHNKSYESPLEAELRFKIFTDNLEIIGKHNARYDAGLETYYMGVNQFTDMTQEEFEQYLTLSGSPPELDENAEVYVPRPGFQAPDSLDYRHKSNVVGPIRKQGGCGSCWAFSALGALESVYAMKNNKLYNLSPQNLVDCSGPYNNSGCYGGWPSNAYNYIRDNGIEQEADYPYVEKDGDCKFDQSRSVMKVTGYIKIEKSENYLKDGVAEHGPISVAVDSKEWGGYKGGILVAKRRFRRLTHAVVVVGYGNESGQDYWIVRNSWGTGWGEQGYARVARNAGNQFGITNVAIVPKV